MRQKLADVTSDFVGKHHSLTLRQTPRWAQSLILVFRLESDFWPVHDITFLSQPC